MGIVISIFIIIGGIFCVLVGIAGIIYGFCCIDPIDHIWAIPLCLLGIFFCCSAFNNIVENKVNERMEQQNIIYEEMEGK